MRLGIVWRARDVRGDGEPEKSLPFAFDPVLCAICALSHPAVNWLLDFGRWGLGVFGGGVCRLMGVDEFKRKPRIGVATVHLRFDERAVPNPCRGPCGRCVSEVAAIRFGVKIFH